MDILAKYSPAFLFDVAALYNVCFAGARNFHPVGASAFRRRVIERPGFDPNGFRVSISDGKLVGVLHVVRGDPEAPGGSPVPAEESKARLAIVFTHPRSRRKGVARQALEATLAELADSNVREVEVGKGNSFYDGMCGGYRQAGIFEDNTAALGLMKAALFKESGSGILYENDMLVMPQKPPGPRAAVTFEARSAGADATIAAIIGGREAGRISYDVLAGVSRYTGHPKCAIHDFRVEPRERRKGIGSALLYLALMRMRPLYRTCELQVDQGGEDEAVKHLTERYGFAAKARWLTFAKGLG